MFQRFVTRYFHSDSFIRRYGIAFGSVAVMLLVRALLHPILGDKSRYIIFLLAVLFTAHYSGTIPALVALALGAFLGNIFFLEPYLTFKFEDLTDGVVVSFYIVVGAAIVYLFDILKRRERQLAAQIIKQAEIEKALRMSEDRFRLVTEALEGAIYDWDAATGVAYRSSGLYEIVGYQPDEVPNTRAWWQDQMHPDDFDTVQRLVQKSIGDREPIHSVEYRVRHKNGHYIWVWDKSRILYDADGHMTRLIGCTLSIDERKHLSDSLAQTEERFRVAFESASDAMAISDAQGVVVDANQAYFELYGYSAEEIVGHSFAIIYPEDIREQSLQRYQQVFDAQDELQFYEATVQRKDGTLRVVEARTGFVALHGKRLYMLSVVRDLTDRKKAEDALYSRYQLTVELSQAVSAEDVGQVAINRLMQHLGAIVGHIYIYHEADDVFDLLYGNTALVSSEQFISWRRFPANPAYPINDVVKHHKALWFSNSEDYEAAYPIMKQFSRSHTRGSIQLPLVVASEVFGAIGFVFKNSRTFTEDEKAFITSLVFQCAQAVQRARLAEKTQTLAVIEERHRLARDLHDNVSQLLFSSSVVSEMLPRLLINKPEKAIQQAEELHLMVRGAMAEMRTLLWELRPENILQTKLSNLLSQLSYAAESRQAIKVSLVVHADNEVILPPDAQIAFYRIAQESIHNVLKHGQASQISIRVRQTDQYTALVIADNGQGFEPEAANAGFGLRNMRERAAGVGALLGINSRVGNGTRVRLLWKTPSH